MDIRTYALSFNTPCFLGDGEQAGAWRTPPLKALIRRWWRVAYLASHRQHGVSAMRRAEAELFGAATEHDAHGASHRSALRIRLGEWRAGKLALKISEKADGQIHHPEVQFNSGRIDPMLYLGYGPLHFMKKEGTRLKGGKAIGVDESARLRVALPAGFEPEFSLAMALIHQFGTAGGRCRNGWGSVDLAPEAGTAPPSDLPPAIQVDWERALEHDWPTGIGRDERGPLVWSAPAQLDWESAMRILAQVRIGIRTAFPFTSGTNAPHPERRHWLAYPVTNHTVGKKHWGNDARLPNSLIFKVRRDGPTAFIPMITHMPCSPAQKFEPDHRTLRDLWSTVHRRLDASDLGQGGRGIQLRRVHV